MKIDTIRRFAFIETRLLYCGGITAREFGVMFGLSRQAAQGIITQYAVLHPGNMERDLSQRRQVASEEFEPKYIRQNVRLFLDHIRGQALSGNFFEEAEWSEEVIVEDISVRVQPRVNVNAVHDLLFGLHQKLSVYAEYRSKENYSSRVLSPHAVIYAHNRYVIRCYCHLKMTFLDFNLSRFKYTLLEPKEEWVSDREDRDWHQYIELRYVPNPELTLETQQVLREDYMLDEKEPLRIRCRKTLAYYIKREMSSGELTPVARWVRI